LDKAKGEWVLSIDADEVVSTELRMEIEKALQQVQVSMVILFPRLSSYCGRQIRHGGWYPDYVLRLFRRNAGYFTDSVVHERIVVQGNIGKLTSPLLHDAFVNLDEVLHKVNSYSTSRSRNASSKRCAILHEQGHFQGILDFCSHLLA
jgi:hypothetical protein